MKIVFVSDSVYPYFKGGKEKRLYELSNRLSRLGHDVHIYTMHWWDQPETVRVKDGLTLHAISKLYPLYKGDKRSIREGVMFGLACLKLRKADWDILDVDHMPFFPIYAAWWVTRWNIFIGRKGPRTRFFGTWHEALSRQDWKEYMGFAGNISWLIEHISIKLPDHITAASQRTVKGLQALHGRKKGVDLVTPGVDIKKLQGIKPAHDAADVLYVGRLVKDKNVDVLISAIQILHKDRPDIRCTIIGAGIERDNLAAQIADLGLQSNISLLEPLAEDSAVYAHMKAAHVFCLPSVREGFGMVAIEALACGTPVVTIDSPANAAKDLIEDNKTGSIVPLYPLALADALSNWLHKPKPAHISDAARDYDWDALARRQAEVYES